MANPSPTTARLAKKAKRKPPSIAEVSLVLWAAIQKAEALMDTAETPELALRCVHAISQAVASYCRIHETGELENRLRALEQQSGSDAA